MGFVVVIVVLTLDNNFEVCNIITFWYVGI